MSDDRIEQLQRAIIQLQHIVIELNHERITKRAMKELQKIKESEPQTANVRFTTRAEAHVANLLALRDPTPAMIEAGGRAMWDSDGVVNIEEAREAAIKIWRAMIDAAQQ